MPLLVDTYNVLHVVGILPPEIAGLDVAGLVSLIGRSRYRRRRITLVCDGVPGDDAPSGPTAPVEIRYSGHGQTADDLIARLVAGSTAPRRLTVVSDDRAVLATARRRRCQTLGAREFLRHLAADHHAPPPPPPPPPLPARSGAPLPPDQVEDWVRRFDVSAADLVPPPLLAPPSPGIAPGSTPEPPPPSPAADGTPPPPTAPARPAGTPGEPLLPTALIRQAMELAAAAAEAEQAAAVEARAEPEAPADDGPRTPPAAEAKPARPDYGAVLPGDLIAQAEAMAAAAMRDRSPPSPDATEQSPTPAASEDPAAGTEGTVDLRPPDPLFTPGILDEAETMWRDAAEGTEDRDPPEPSPPASDGGR